MTLHAVPLVGVETLRALARRTTAIRATAAATLLVLVLAAILVGRHPHVRDVQFLPKQSDGIVVLDLSASISTDTYSRIAATLNDLVKTHGRYGLVIFSDTAYEALPPGTPADALRPLGRFFAVPQQESPGVAPAFPVNPWTNSFSGGTKISAGLELARAILLDRRLARPAVLLISDLDDDLGDRSELNDIALTYKREHLLLNVVGLNASPDDERFYKQLRTGSVTEAPLSGRTSAQRARTSFPIWLVAVALVLALVLAANELWGARLTWDAHATTEAA
jgi:hypothetical protein